MSLLDDRVRKQVESALNTVTQPVKLVVFTQGEGGALECAFCGETRQLVEEVGKISDKLEVEVLDFQADAELARTYGVDKIPAVVMLSGGDRPTHHGIRFYGIPSGYEFSSFVEGLRMLGSGQVTLAPSTREALDKLTQPVHIQVFVTPT